MVVKREPILIVLAAAALSAPACFAPGRTGVGLAMVQADFKRENPDDQGPFVGRKHRASTYVARAEAEAPEVPRSCALAKLGTCLGEALSRVASSGAD